jgi:hypothetical protein
LRRHLIGVAAATELLLGFSASSRAVPILDVVFLMDGSNGIQSAGWAAEKSFVTGMINTGVALTSGVSVITYGPTASTLFDLSYGSPRSPLVNAVNALTFPAFPSNNDAGALIAAIDEFEAHSAPDHAKLLLFLTDGVPNPKTPCALPPRRARAPISRRITS